MTYMSETAPIPSRDLRPADEIVWESGGVSFVKNVYPSSEGVMVLVNYIDPPLCLATGTEVRIKGQPDERTACPKGVELLLDSEELEARDAWLRTIAVRTEAEAREWERINNELNSRLRRLQEHEARWNRRTEGLTFERPAQEVPGVMIEADSLEDAEAKLAELGHEDLPLLFTNDPRVQA